ncbi:MAG: sugar phosphate isomerase/epimerase family protein [Planctomycetota bacterium]|jgi:sugar phosphate isomerase/epimerase
MRWTLSAFADEAGDTIDEQVAALVEAQIDHVDLRNLNGYNITNLPVDFASEVKAKLDEAGISVCMYGSPIGKIDIADDFELDVEKLKHLGEMKRIFGATCVRMFSYFNKASAPLDEWRSVAVDRLLRLADLAGELGLVLYHENELGIFGGPLEQVKVLRDEVHAKKPEQFKLIFDFDNYNQCGEDVWGNWLELRDTTGAIHIKESKRQDDGGLPMHVPAGQGDGYIAEIFADLAERGWDGPLTLEPHLGRSAGVVATGAHGQANQALADLSNNETFQIAAKAARELIGQVNRL